MKYIVTQKIKPFGLQAGDVFEEIEDGVFFRKYKKICGAVIIPKVILDTHPDWFQKIPEVIDLDFVKETIKKVRKIYTSSSSKKALNKLVELLENK